MAKPLSTTSKTSKEKLFPILAAVLAILFGGVAIYSVTFLVSHLNEALNTEVRASAPPSFDIQGFEKLNLISK